MSARPPQYLLDELQRLQELEANSLEDLSAYLHNLDMEISDAISEGVLSTKAVMQERNMLAKHRGQPLATALTKPTRRLSGKRSSTDTNVYQPTKHRKSNSDIPVPQPTTDTTPTLAKDTTSVDTTIATDAANAST